MRIDITTYKGWSIQLDTSSEVFSCTSNYYDKEEGISKTLSGIKAYIDKFLKANNVFQPTVVIKQGGWGSPPIYDKEPVTIIGVRKDGNFMIEKAEGKKVQMSRHDEKDYELFTEDHIKYMKVYKDTSKDLDEFREKINLIRKDAAETHLKNVKKITDLNLKEGFIWKD